MSLDKLDWGGMLANFFPAQTIEYLMDMPLFVLFKMAEWKTYNQTLEIYMKGATSLG